MLLTVLCGTSLGYFLSSIFNKQEDAVGISPVILMPLVLFGGLFANSGGYPDWISWF
jgi:ABC-type transport system involved in multi-copper enzyme maturation permease subunit